MDIQYDQEYDSECYYSEFYDSDEYDPSYESDAEPNPILAIELKEIYDFGTPWFTKDSMREVMQQIRDVQQSKEPGCVMVHGLKWKNIVGRSIVKAFDPRPRPGRLPRTNITTQVMYEISLFFSLSHFAPSGYKFSF
jgi:hypothetical protein